MYALTQCRRFISQGVKPVKAPAKRSKSLAVPRRSPSSLARLYSTKAFDSPIVVKSMGTEKMANVARGMFFFPILFKLQLTDSFSICLFLRFSQG